ncbi:Uncharacterised protein [Oligella ureolytica]|uniref:Uncharacterized protein n=1 Tax=Oligella ureolytica TaxID=90244 RepID=A0A378XHR3_9BURK|nr:hypothetical protein [Oligella ureolytica]QPT39461.1 hypothetical protein I6G29_09890 [Oligella ureolytica]SUA53144.1 Uncharacterised protein [Oligella ureolytica]SUA56276.1 Uncharacterised protein [Oligella ureolytica]
MFNKQFLILAALFLFATGGAQAHTPLCSCYDNGDGTVECEGGFSDGSSASGVPMVVYGPDNQVLVEGKLDANSIFIFDKPEGEFKVVFEGGEGHTVEIPSSRIVE